MTARFCLGLLLQMFAAAFLSAQTPAAAGKPVALETQFPEELSTGPGWFPKILAPYEERRLPSFVLENSPRLRDLIRGGKLELSLPNALALALENNLDIAVQRYVLPISQTDVLRARSGQAARGFQGASIPGGLSAGAIGAGVSAASGAGGFGSAGGITGGGGAVSIGQVGTFDPAINFNFSWDRVSSPLNTLQVAGVPSVTTTSTAFTGAYTQLFPTGTSYFLALNGLSQSSTQQFLRFNPAVITRFALGFNQPLLSGFGFLPNKRFLLVAQNNRKVSEDLFRLQVINTIVNVENLYWDMAAFQENVRVATQSLAVAQKLLQDNRTRAEIGTMATLDVITAQSEVAARQRDLVVARTNLQLQETRLKNALSKRLDAELSSAQIVTIDPLPQVTQGEVPDLEQALARAYENRPELSQARTNLQNQDIASRFTRNTLKPSLALFGLYAGSGLEGDSTTERSGAGASLGQAFGGDYPEKAGGMSLSIPIRNRAAQADDLRAQLELDQLRVGMQRERNQIGTEVRQGIIGLVQGQAQEEAALEAVRLGRKTLEAEQYKLEQGVSTSYNVILRERDLVTAQLAEVQARTAYAKAVVEMDRSTGMTLERNNIQFSDAVSGTVKSMPVPSFKLGVPPAGGRP